MNTTKKNKSMLLAIPAIVLMICSGFLFSWTINDLYGISSAFVTLSLSLLAIMLYVAGSAFMGKNLSKGKKINALDNTFLTCKQHESEKFVLLYASHGIASGVMIAFLLIAVGALLLCFNMDLFPSVWKSFFFSWPMLLFVIGTICICKFHFFTGIIAVTASFFFLLEKASTIYPHDIQAELIISSFWPAVFILAGVVIILSFIIRPKIFSYRHPKGNWKEDFVAGKSENNDGKIDYHFVFCGTEQVILDPVFKGGSIEVVFGGMELDLRRTSLAEDTTTLYVKAVFGGVEIKAPDTWYIEIISDSLAGGVSDSRSKHAEIDRTRKLVIYAKSTFGGISIK